MNIGQIIFMFLTFGILKFMIVTTYGTSTETYAIGDFQPPEFPSVHICFDGDNQTDCDATFYHFQSSDCDLFDFTCSSVAQATQNVAIAIINVFISLYIAILFIVKLVIYITLLLAFIIAILFSTIPGAPWYINAILISPILIIFGVIIFKLFRKGDSNA